MLYRDPTEDQVQRAEHATKARKLGARPSHQSVLSNTTAAQGTDERKRKRHSKKQTSDPDPVITM
jgi:hypothetical protein